MHRCGFRMVCIHLLRTSPPHKMGIFSATTISWASAASANPLDLNLFQPVYVRAIQIKCTKVLLVIGRFLAIHAREACKRTKRLTKSALKVRLCPLFLIVNQFKSDFFCSATSGGRGYSSNSQFPIVFICSVTLFSDHRSTVRV